MKIKGKTPNWQ